MTNELTATKNLLKEAAEQRILMQDWLDDQAFVKDGGRVWYAIDTDIVKLFIATREMALRFKTRRGYAEMFSVQDSKQSVALGYALAEHIFFKLGGSGDREAPPLLIMPGHDSELEQMIKAIASDTLREQYHSYKIEGWLSAVQESIDAAPEDELLDKFEQHFPKYLERFLRADPPAMELARYRNRIWQERRLVPINFAPNGLLDATEHGLHGAAETAFAEPASVLEQIELADLRRQWYERLSAITRGQKDWAVLDDARALARVEWISRRFARLGESAGKHRLALITGANSIRTALDHPDTPHETKASVHIRHPRAYVGVPEIIVPALKESLSEDKINHDGHDSPDFVGWLDTLLGESGPRCDLVNSRRITAMDDSGLETLSSEIMRNRPRVVTEFETRLSKYLNGVVKTQVSALGRGGLEPTLFEMLARKGMTRGKLLDHVRAELNQRWNDLFFVSVLVGGRNVLAPVADQDARPARIPSPLVFDQFKGPQEFFAYLYKTGVRSKEIDESSVDGKFSEHLKAVQEYDAENYYLFLAHAAIFACAGNWHLAESTAEMACSVAPKANKKKNHIDGREAWFMLGTAKRHNARTEAELSDANSAFGQAEQIFEKEDTPTKKWSALPLRVSAERAAIKVARQLFRKFSPDNTGAEELRSQPVQFDLQNCRELARLLESELKEVQAAIARRPSDKEDYRRDALRVAERHLLSDWFTVQFSLAGGALLSDKEIVARAAIYRDQLSSIVKKQESFLPMVLLAMANVFLAGERQLKQQLATTAQEELDKADKHLLWVHDDLRYADLRSLLKQTTRLHSVS